MELIEKRTIYEALELVQLEPTLSSIYVEGPTDKVILDNFFNRIGIQDVYVCSIDSLDFSQLYRERPILIDNNKEKVIELSRLLADRYDCDSTKIICVVDKDFDDIISGYTQNGFLIRTDYSCMEMYTFDNLSLQYFIDNILHGFIVPTIVIISEFTKVLIELFCIRCAIKILLKKQIEYDYIDFGRLCLIDKGSGRIDFNSDQYLYRMLNKLGELSRRDEYHLLIQDIKMRLINDVKNYIHGHDYTHLLCIYIKKIKNEHFKEEILTRTLFVCLQYDKLIQYPLFSRISRKFATKRI